MVDTEFLKNIWYYAAPAAKVGPKPLGKVICDEPIVLARDGAGAVYALRDICPHRGIPLSDGFMTGGEVTCCYHGWQFNGAGTCTKIPSLVAGQDFEPGKIKVKTYPVIERAGNVWVWLGDKPADEALLPQLPTNATPNLVETQEFPCFIDHAVIGLMDPAHGPFVHQSWWWRSGKSIHEKAKKFGPTPYGFAMLKHRPSSNSKAYKILGGVPETEIRFQLPGVRIEHIVVGAHQVVNLTTVTPITATRTEINQSLYWTMPWLSVLRPVLRPFVRSFLAQDRGVVVKQQKGLAYDPTLLLIKDADTQARWYAQLKAELVRAEAEARPFENPVKETTLRWRS